MTCIVGLVHRGTVWIGGDSLGTAYLDSVHRADPKVFRSDGFVFGFTSSYRMGQLLRYQLKVPVRGRSELMRYMATDFIEAIRGCLKSGGYTVVKDNQESGGSFLVAHAGRLFRIEDDFQVGETRIGFDAVGYGFAYALGSLWESRGKRPRDRVRKALEAAERFSAGVQRPFTILRL